MPPRQQINTFRDGAQSPVWHELLACSPGFLANEVNVSLECSGNVGGGKKRLEN